MRGELKERVGVERIKREILEATVNENVNKAIDEVLKLIESSNRLIFTYAGPYSSPARYVTLVLNSLAGKECRWIHPQDLMYYLAPYDEGVEAWVTVLASDEGLNTLSLLTDQLVWTRHNVSLITQHELPDVIRYKLPDNVSVVSLNTNEWLMASHLVVAMAAAKSVRKGIRRDRLLKEFSSISPIVDDLIEEYEEEILKAVEMLRNPVIITATPTMWGAAEYVTYSRSLKTGRYLIEPEAVPQISVYVGRVILFSTDVEEYAVKQIKSLTLMTSVKVLDIRIHTDPLTAPMYGLILAKAINNLSSKT